MSRILIFTGPTLDEETIEELLPAAEIYPPVAAGDLLRLPLQAGDLVAIIDGFYFQSASVRHKEILDLLQRGVHVWGAGSMGALRAAELAPFGMRGFGSVFQAYVDGVIDGDDEVAVLHTPQDMGYMKLTEALVNIRAACQTAVKEQLLSEEDGQRLLRIASDLPFFERSYARIWQLAAAAGFADHTIKALQPFVLQKRHDQKRKDALEMLAALRAFVPQPFRASFQVQETSLLRDWKLAEQGIMLNEQWIADSEILVAYQLLGEDYPQVHHHCLSGQLVQLAQAADQHALPCSEHEHAQQIARFLATTYGLPLDGPLPDDAHRWLTPSEHELSRPEQLVLLAVRLWHVARSRAWQAEMIRTLKATELYRPLATLVSQARQFNQQLQERDPNIRLERLSPTKMRTWAMQRWQLPDADFAIARLDRGFKSASAFFAAASTFYLFDKYKGIDRLSLAQAAS